MLCLEAVLVYFLQLLDLLIILLARSLVVGFLIVCLFSCLSLVGDSVSKAVPSLGCR